MLEEVPFEKFVWHTTDDHPGLPEYWQRRFPGLDDIVYEIIAESNAGKEIDREKLALATEQMREFNEKLKTAHGRSSCSEEIAPIELFEFKTKEDVDQSCRNLLELPVSEFHNRE